MIAMLGPEAVARIGDVAISYIAIVMVASVVAYHVRSRGQWRRTWMGRHLMAFMAGFAAAAALGATRAVAVDLFHQRDPFWFQALRTATLAGPEAAVVTWRFIIILIATSRPLPGGDVATESESEPDHE